MEVGIKQHRFPFCIVWTPIPFISWLFPFIGHLGIATSKGVIRDFAGSNFVSEDDMAFGWPTLYHQLSPGKVNGGAEVWDRAVAQASDEYKKRVHNLFCDNCHSHVALALNTMRYGGKSNWNNFRVGADVHLHGKLVGFDGFLRQFLPFFLIILIIAIAHSFLFIPIMVRISVDVVNDAYQFINPCKQREISLRNLQIPTIENLGVTKDQFDVIDLSDNNIRKLDNLPKLRRLETLLLHNNRVDLISKEIGDQLTKLSTLVLTNNNLAQLGDVDSLAACPRLEYLSLQGNPLTHLPKYRQYVIYKLKNVRVLDYKRIRLAERQAAKKLFKGETGAQLKRELVKRSLNDMENGEETEQLPKKRATEEQKKIRELISGVKTLADVERVQQILQNSETNGSEDQQNGEDAHMEQQ
uniref:Probable U2 small nuclear ribonucleoprotein A' n=1 Tax=Globodera pallida TaxID=36090 RepID=A0A183C1X1_GLOPA